MGIKVSVVVPVYNTEQWLGECLDSIVNQTLDEIEIICVNDGSTDGSPQILSEYAKKDNRFIVKHKNNGGQSSARNYGMKLAQGQYIYFMDSDDTLEENALEELYSLAEKNRLDILYFCANVVFEGPNIKKEHSEYCDAYHRTLSADKLLSEELMKIYLNHEDTYYPSVPLQFFNADFLKKTGVSFFEGIIHEDELFSPQVLANAKNVMVSSIVYYNRTVRYDSTMTKQKTHKNFDGYFIGAVKLLSYTENFRENNTVNEFLINRSTVLFEMSQYIYDLLSKEEKEKILQNFPEEYVVLFNKISFFGAHEITKTITYRIGKMITYIPCAVRNYLRGYVK